MALPRASNTKAEFEGELPGPQKDEECCLAIRFKYAVAPIKFTEIANDLSVAGVPIPASYKDLLHIRGYVFFGKASQLRLVIKRLNCFDYLSREIYRPLYGPGSDVFSYEVVKSDPAFDFGVPMLKLG
jgi:hypothetical protein